MLCLEHSAILLAFIKLPFVINGPQGFRGAGENGYLFSGSWEALVIIVRDLGFGEQAHSFGDFGSPVKKLKKNLTLKETPSFCLIFFLKIFFWE